MALYDLDAASERAHYAPRTIANRCHDGTLRRGIDFVVRTYRRGIYKRAILLLTDSGIAALIARQSRAIRKAHEDARITLSTATPSEPHTDR